jgi:hypothetical protein
MDALPAVQTPALGMTYVFFGGLRMAARAEKPRSDLTGKPLP